MASLAGFLKAIFGICETPPLNAELWRMEGKRVAIRLAEATALAPVGGAVRLEGKGLASSVLVVHADTDEYLAFENRCTHSGRKLDPAEGKPQLRCCSVGHSRFDYQGNKLSGPAKGPLTPYRVETQGEELIVSLETASA
jgi:nitrite reductase/ring-hydroxylating ferredoxin subunit